MLVSHSTGLVAFEIADDSPLARTILLRDAKAEAASALVAYPQYDGYWDGPEWVLVTVGRSVKTKMGQAFEKGEVVLARPGAPEPRYGIEEHWVAWSRSNRCHTHLPVAWAEVSS